MTSITPQRRIAIAVIKAFRIKLDEMIKPNDTVDDFIDQQTKIAIRFFFGSLIDLPPALADNLKQMFKEMNSDCMSYINQMYDTLLPETITRTMTRLENHLESKFSVEELEALAVISESKAVEKILCDSLLFAILQNEKHQMHIGMEELLMQFKIKPEFRELVDNAVQDFIRKAQNDENLLDDGGSLDPRDIF